MSYMHGAASPFGGTARPSPTRRPSVKKTKSPPTKKPLSKRGRSIDDRSREAGVNLSKDYVMLGARCPGCGHPMLTAPGEQVRDRLCADCDGSNAWFLKHVPASFEGQGEVRQWLASDDAGKQDMVRADDERFKRERAQALGSGEEKKVSRNPLGDAERRRLERLAAQGDVEALARLRAQQVRTTGGFRPTRSTQARPEGGVFLRGQIDEYDFPNGITAYVSWTVDPEAGIRRPNDRGDVVWLRAERATSLAIHRRRRVEVRNAYVDSTAYYPGGPGVRVERGFKHQPIILAFSQEAVEAGLLARALALISELNPRQIGVHWDRGRGDYTGFCGYKDAYSKVTSKRQYVTCEDCLTIGDEVMARRRAERRRAARRKPKQNPDDFRSERERRARAYGDPAEVHAAAIEALRTGRMPEDWAVRCQVLAERVRRGEVRVVDPYEHRVYKRGVRCLEREDVGMPYTRIVHLVDEEPHSRGDGESYWYVEGPYAEGYSGNRVGWNVDVRNLLAAPMSAGNQSFWIEVRQLNPHLNDRPDPSGYTVVISWLNTLCNCVGGPDGEHDTDDCPGLTGMRRLSEWSVGLCALMDPSADWNLMRQARLRVPPMLADLFTREEPQTLSDQILSAARRYTRWQTGTAT